MERDTTESDPRTSTEDGGADGDADGGRGTAPDTRVSVQSIPHRFTPVRRSVRFQQLGWFLGSFLVVGSVTWVVAYGASLATVATFLIGVVVLGVSFPLAELRGGPGGDG